MAQTDLQPKKSKSSNRRGNRLPTIVDSNFDWISIPLEEQRSDSDGSISPIELVYAENEFQAQSRQNDSYEDNGVSSLERVSLCGNNGNIWNKHFNISDKEDNKTVGKDLNKTFSEKWKE